MRMICVLFIVKVFQRVLYSNFFSFKALPRIPYIGSVVSPDTWQRLRQHVCPNIVFLVVSEKIILDNIPKHVFEKKQRCKSLSETFVLHKYI